MVTLFIILMITACVGLGFIVLIQNPKGGGLNANVSGLSNNFMGVKQTTDVLEKGTWIFAAVIAVLCLLSTFFINATNTGSTDKLDNISTAPVQSAPVPQGTTSTAPGALPKGTASPQTTPSK